jgi:hypothetical protein
MTNLFQSSLLILLFSASSVAQISLSGVWTGLLHEDFVNRLPGPALGDYGGLPINAAARVRASSWSASLISQPEYQCRVHPADYAPSFGNIRVWEEVDKETQRVVAIHIHHFAFGSERTIWMDMRPHPLDYAMHSAMGFSTGKWDADTLTVTTTHLTEGYLRANGVPRSDRAVMTEHFIRHGDHLTWVVYVQDSAYLTEPVIWSYDYEFSVGGSMPPYPCDTAIETDRPKDEIPRYLPGKNPFLSEYATKNKIPENAAMGGAETMYPEYRNKEAGSTSPK